MNTPQNKLGFGDNKVTVPTSLGEVNQLLAKIMAHSINNTVDLDAARTALNAATRMVEVIQADTRMKALAIASNRTITRSSGWDLVSVDAKSLPAPDGGKK